MMITAQKPGDLGSKKFSCRFGDLKLKKLEIWGFRDPPSPPPEIMGHILKISGQSIFLIVTMGQEIKDYAWN